MVGRCCVEDLALDGYQVRGGGSQLRVRRRQVRGGGSQLRVRRC
jgi:hypothetical protein